MMSDWWLVVSVASDASIFMFSASIKWLVVSVASDEVASLRDTL